MTREGWARAGRFTGGAVTLFGTFCGLLLLAGFFGAWHGAADSLAHFRPYFALGLAAASLLLCLWRQWRRAAMGGAVALVGLAGMWPALPFMPLAGDDGGAAKIRAIQLNLSFTHGTPEEEAALVLQSGADIVTLQEVSGKKRPIMDLLARDYPHSVFCPFSRVIGGVAVLSRLPRAPGGAAGCVEGRGMAWMRVMAGGQELSVVSLHLHWPWPFRQARQIDVLGRYLAAVPRPVMVGGDFNATPWSHAVGRVAAATGSSVAPGLRLSFDINHSRWPLTLPMPIDHFLLPDGMRPLALRVGPGAGSDHRSIIAELALPADPGATLSQR